MSEPAAQVRLGPEKSGALSLTATLAILFALVSVGVLAVTNAFVFFIVEQQWRRGVQQDLEVGANALRILVASVTREGDLATRGTVITSDLSRIRRLSFSVGGAREPQLLSTLPKNFPETAFSLASDLERPRDFE